MYDILGKMNLLEGRGTRPDFLDLNKNKNFDEPMKAAAADADKPKKPFSKMAEADMEEGNKYAHNVLKAKAAGTPSRRMVQIRLEGGSGAPLVHHNEPILLDGRMIGSVTTGAFGHRVGASLALGMIRSEDGVDASFLANGRFEVEIACERFPAELSLGAWYDPKQERVRA